MRRQRPPKRLKVPSVASMTDTEDMAKPDAEKPEKPADEMSEDLKRTVKAAYQ